MASKAWQRFCADVRGKRVLLLGLGTLGGGEGVARALTKAGANVRVTDKKTSAELRDPLNRLRDLPLELSLGQERIEDVEWAEMIVKNPSVPNENPLVLHARKIEKTITNDVALFLKYTDTKTIGITGTRGKTTTTAMVFGIFKSWDQNTRLGGNIPGEPCLPLLEDENEQSWTVLELSSFQLEGCHDAKQSPHASVITNLYPDHLNRYASMEGYAFAKAAIVAYQQEGDVAVLSKKNEWTPFFLQYVKSTHTLYDPEDLPKDLILQVPGEHNRANASAALAVAGMLQVPAQIIHSALEHFSGVPYRLETVGVWHGIRYINDTTSTTPVALIQALHSTPGPKHMIVGGASKGIALDEVVKELQANATRIYLLEGSGTTELKRLLPLELVAGEYSSMKDAVLEASRLAQAGENVILSPGFASFGMFHNEFDRGDQFNTVVQSLGQQ